MAYKRQYRKGELISSIDELYSQEFVYSRDKIMHHGWFASWQIRAAYNAIRRGEIHKAIKIQEDNNG